MCQKLLDLVKVFKRYKQKCALASIFGPHGITCILGNVYYTAMLMNNTGWTCVRNLFDKSISNSA